VCFFFSQAEQQEEVQHELEGAHRAYGWLLPPSRAEVDAAASAALQAPQPFFRL
jgi:hypothetical protein